MNLLEQLIASIAPHECLGCGLEGTLLCSPCQHHIDVYAPCCYRCSLPADRGVCSACAPSSPLSSVISRTRLRGTAKELIHGLKFERQRAAAAPIAAMMTSRMSAYDRAWHIVPLPTASGRIRTRGYDQAVEIARELVRRTSNPLLLCLARQGQFRQVGQGRVARRAQMHSAFRVVDKAAVRSTRIILIDDVITTGASIESAAHALLNAGAAEVRAVTFASA